MYYTFINYISLAFLQAQEVLPMNKPNHSSIIRWITSFIVLAALFFILPASCDDPNMNGGSTNGGGSTDGGGNGGGDGDGVMPPAPPPPTTITEAPGITSGGASISVSVTMSHALAGVTIYYRAASDTTTDLSDPIDPTDMSTYTGTGTTASPATFSSPGDVYRIKAVAVATDGVLSPETAIQRFDYDIDGDNDGLIEIRNLDMFDNIRNNLAGTTYDDEALDTGTGDIGITFGGSTAATANCPTPTNGVYLCGYELMVNLDFAQESSYVSGSTNWTNNTWRPVDEVTPDSSSMDEVPDSAVNAGFPGIGAASGNTGGFNAIFEGNGNTIANFYSRNTTATGVYIGLFRSTDSTAQIRSLGVTDGNVYGGTGGGDNVGVLLGVNRGTIIASSATGSADGGVGNADRVGSLVGNNAGSIIASYATGSAGGGVGDEDYVGGLVGLNNSGATITASYATGDGDDATTSDADGGGGDQDDVGGLVGNNAGTIIASYATGSANGGAGDFDFVGGLLGTNDTGGIITASYAIGDANGGDGLGDFVGKLVGISYATIIASYGFGTATGESDGGDGSILPTILGVAITSATQLNASGDATTGDAGTSPWWNEASMTDAGAWNFGDGTENPALVYSDYDGDSSNTYPSCSDAEGLFLTIPGTTTQIVCGITLVGGYRAP